MERITKTMLASKLHTLGNLLNIPTSPSDAEKEGKSEYLSLDHSSVYGGYAIVLVSIPSYSESCPFGNGRMNASRMFDKLTDIISGIYAAKKIAVGETI